jgi:hypothetical protein
VSSIHSTDAFVTASRLRSALGGLLLAASTVMACAAPADDVEAIDEEMLTTVGAAAAEACGDKFRPAFKRYKAAVEGAKARLADGPCDSEGEDTTQSRIADNATAAVMICPAFKDVIRKSPFAKPIRTVLAASLTLKSLTGELLVLRDSEFANWTGVEALLPGTTFSTEHHGVVGAHAQITFHGNGRATFSETVSTPELSPRTTVTPATYRVEKLGSERDPRRIFVERAGKTERFDLVVFSPNEEDFESAPDFMLRAEGHEGLHFENVSMSSITLECGD